MVEERSITDRKTSNPFTNSIGMDTLTVEVDAGMGILTTGSKVLFVAVAFAENEIRDKVAFAKDDNKNTVSIPLRFDLTLNNS